MSERVMFRTHDLDASRSVVMNDSGNFGLRFRAGEDREDHVVVGVVVVVHRTGGEDEILFGGGPRHHRSERPDRLAVLHAEIDVLQRVWIARVRDDRAMPQRARSRFRRSLEDAENSIARQHERHEVGHVEQRL